MELSLEERIAEFNLKMGEIERLKNRRGIILSLVSSYSLSSEDASWMMNPLASLNVALTKEVIDMLLNTVSAELNKSLVETETTLQELLEAGV